MKGLQPHIVPESISPRIGPQGDGDQNVFDGINDEVEQLDSSPDDGID